MTDSDLTEEIAAAWYPYEGGSTINQVGGQGGYILRDEEFGDREDPEGADARLTMEQGRADNPGFFLTAALYGWMLHTVKYENRAEADTAFDILKEELTKLTEFLPYEEDGKKRIELKAKQLTEAIASLEERFV